MRSSLIIFTLNEIEAARKLFNEIPLDRVYECIVIDGGSTDGTVEFFKNKGLEVVIQSTPGHGEAFKLGMQKATGDMLVFFGCDGNNRPNDIPILIEKLSQGYDLVIASRFGKDSSSHDATPIRKFGNWLFTFLVNARWNSKLTDVFNEFRGIKKEYMERLDLKTSYFDLELEMIIKALKQGLRIAEVPTVEGARIGGTAKLNTWKDGLMNLKCFLRELI